MHEIHPSLFHCITGLNHAWAAEFCRLCRGEEGNKGMWCKVAAAFCVESWNRHRREIQEGNDHHFLHFEVHMQIASGDALRFSLSSKGRWQPVFRFMWRPETSLAQLCFSALANNYYLAIMLVWEESVRVWDLETDFITMHRKEMRNWPFFHHLWASFSCLL